MRLLGENPSSGIPCWGMLVTKIGEGIILAPDVFQFQSCWLPLNSSYSIMKHFKHRKSPSFVLLTGPCFGKAGTRPRR